MAILEWSDDFTVLNYSGFDFKKGDIVRFSLCEDSKNPVPFQILEGTIDHLDTAPAGNLIYTVRMKNGQFFNFSTETGRTVIVSSDRGIMHSYINLAYYTPNMNVYKVS